MTDEYQRPDIYQRHDAAFADIEAAVVIDPKTCQRVATLAFKRARSGLRVTCYVHVIGTRMAAGIANGGGYDKHSAAAANAVRRVKTSDPDQLLPPSREAVSTLLAFTNALKDDGTTWDRALEDAGFRVFRAV